MDKKNFSRATDYTKADINCFYEAGNRAHTQKSILTLHMLRGKK
jgi:hypothetical protein